MTRGALTWNTSSFLPKQATPAMGLTRDDVMFMPAPVTHALGLTLGLMAPTLVGASVEPLDIFRPAAALERITQCGCTGTASPAPFIRMMLDAYDPAAHDVSRLRFWLTAGAPVPAVLVEEAAARFSGCRVVPGLRLQRGHDGHGLHPGRPDRAGRLLRRTSGPRRRAPDRRRRRGRPGRRGG
jgi:acyl-CoA synthetase (AMP-forming)/AMP-acid ligase II